MSAAVAGTGFVVAGCEPVVDPLQSLDKLARIADMAARLEIVPFSSGEIAFGKEHAKKIWETNSPEIERLLLPYSEDTVFLRVTLGDSWELGKKENERHWGPILRAAEGLGLERQQALTSLYSLCRELPFSSLALQNELKERLPWHLRVGVSDFLKVLSEKSSLDEFLKAAESIDNSQAYVRVLTQMAVLALQQETINPSLVQKIEQTHGIGSGKLTALIFNLAREQPFGHHSNFTSAHVRERAMKALNLSSGNDFVPKGNSLPGTVAGTLVSARVLNNGEAEYLLALPSNDIRLTRLSSRAREAMNRARDRQIEAVKKLAREQRDAIAPVGQNVEDKLSILRSVLSTIIDGDFRIASGSLPVVIEKILAPETHISYRGSIPVTGTKVEVNIWEKGSIASLFLSEPILYRQVYQAMDLGQRKKFIDRAVSYYRQCGVPFFNEAFSPSQDLKITDEERAYMLVKIANQVDKTEAARLLLSLPMEKQKNVIALMSDEKGIKTLADITYELLDVDTQEDAHLTVSVFPRSVGERQDLRRRFLLDEWVKNLVSMTTESNANFPSLWSILHQISVRDLKLLGIDDQRSIKDAKLRLFWGTAIRAGGRLPQNERQVYFENINRELDWAISQIINPDENKRNGDLSSVGTDWHNLVRTALALPASLGLSLPSRRFTFIPPDFTPSFSPLYFHLPHAYEELKQYTPPSLWEQLAVLPVVLREKERWKKNQEIQTKRKRGDLWLKALDSFPPAVVAAILGHMYQQGSKNDLAGLWTISGLTGEKIVWNTIVNLYNRGYTGAGKFLPFDFSNVFAGIGLFLEELPADLRILEVSQRARASNARDEVFDPTVLFLRRLLDFPMLPGALVHLGLSNERVRKIIGENFKSNLSPAEIAVQLAPMEQGKLLMDFLNFVAYYARHGDPPLVDWLKTVGPNEWVGGLVEMMRTVYGIGMSVVEKYSPAEIHSLLLQLGGRGNDINQSPVNRWVYETGGGNLFVHQPNTVLADFWRKHMAKHESSSPLGITGDRLTEVSLQPLNDNNLQVEGVPVTMRQILRDSVLTRSGVEFYVCGLTPEGFPYGYFDFGLRENSSGVKDFDENFFAKPPNLISGLSQSYERLRVAITRGKMVVLPVPFEELVGSLLNYEDTTNLRQFTKPSLGPLMAMLMQLGKVPCQIAGKKYRVTLMYEKNTGVWEVRLENPETEEKNMISLSNLFSQLDPITLSDFPFWQIVFALAVGKVVGLGRVVKWGKEFIKKVLEKAPAIPFIGGALTIGGGK